MGHTLGEMPDGYQRRLREALDSGTIETELTEARQLNRRYRDALQLIRERPDPWCEDYAMCDHAGCKASHRAFEIATNALDVESSF